MRIVGNVSYSFALCSLLKICIKLLKLIAEYQSYKLFHAHCQRSLLHFETVLIAEDQFDNFESQKSRLTI